MIETMTGRITWLGHASFRIDAGKIIYIDPFDISQGPKADIILITHSHYDHCSPEDINKIKKADTIYITEKSSAKKLKGDVRQIKAGESIELDNIKIEALASYNINKEFHPEKNGWLGFIIEMEGVRLYHAGDSDYIQEMKEIKADIALLPVSGTYVMTAEEAVLAALDINPEIAIPMHYGTLVGDIKDAERFKNKLAGKINVKVPDKEKTIFF